MSRLQEPAALRTPGSSTISLCETAIEHASNTNGIRKKAVHFAGNASVQFARGPLNCAHALRPTRYSKIMLQPLRLGPIHDAPASQFLPSLLQPLMRAAQHGEDVAPIALAIAKGFGFDGFWYAVSLSLQPSQETKVFVYSTWPEPLTRLYDERAYIEIDPRIQDVIATVLPIVWDQSTYRGRSGIVDAFLDVMQMHGVASGLMCSLRDNRGRVAALSMSSEVPVLDEVGKLNVARNLGDVLMFQRYFHELFVTGVLNEFVPPYLQGRRLSRRELECLKLSAAGLSGEEIAVKLAISARTVQNHFDSMRSKLGAVNRQQVIYFATQTGLLAQ